MEENGIVQGAEVQEVTEPATTTTEPVNPTEGATETNQPEESTSEPTADGQKEGKTEEDSRFASVRRKAEEDAKAKYGAEIQKWNEAFKNEFGSFSNPKTGKPIEGVADYFEALRAQNELAREQELRSKGIDPRMIEEMVNNNPIVQKANEVIQQNQQTEAQRQLEADLKAVSEMDPSIKTLEDLAKHPSYPRVYDFVAKNGLSVADAYYLANRSELSAKSNAAAKQAAINQVKGKNHLEATKAGVANNDNLAEVPASLAATWKMMNPDLTESQIQVKYNEFLKNTGGK